MTLLYWLALGVSGAAVALVLIGVGYLLGLKLAARRVATVREELERDRETRRTRMAGRAV